MKHCPVCNALNPDDARFCGVDGTPLPQAAASPPEGEVAEEATLVKPASVPLARPPKLAELEALLNRQEVEEIYILGPQRILVTCSDGSHERLRLDLGGEAELVAMCRYLLGPQGDDLGPDAPFADGAIMENHRLHVAMNPAAEPSPQFVIRRHRKIFQPGEDRLLRLLKLGTLSSRAALLLRYAVRAEVSILVAGATASGKSTFLGALGAELPELTPVICVEDTRELDLPGENVSYLLTRPPNLDSPAITQRLLVQQALRKRPRWMILGEARGEEAWDLAQAGNTGHAIMGSVHANGCRDALERFRDLSMTTGTNINDGVALTSVLRAFRLVVYLEQNRRGGARKVQRIVDVTGNLADGHIPVLQDLFIREDGRLRCTRNRPYPRLKLLFDRAGLDYDDVVRGKTIPEAWRKAVHR